MTDWTGITGKHMHLAHCREDRCVYGCDCPHHQGVDMSFTFPEKVQNLLNRVSYRLHKMARRQGE